MKCKILVFLCSVLLILSGCATTHPGLKGVTDKKDGQLVVSVAENTSLSDDFYGFFEYTFENVSDEWKRMRVVHVGFPNFENHILINNDLHAWIEGAELKFKQNRHNMALLTVGVAALGGVIAGTSSNRNTQVFGAGVMAASMGPQVGVSFSDSMIALNAGQKGLNRTVNVPKNHVFVPFSVAPKSFVRRWVVLKTPKIKESEQEEGKGELLTGLDLEDGKEVMEFKFKKIRQFTKQFIKNPKRPKRFKRPKRSKL